MKTSCVRCRTGIYLNLKVILLVHGWFLGRSLAFNQCVHQTPSTSTALRLGTCHDRDDEASSVQVAIPQLTSTSSRTTSRAAFLSSSLILAVTAATTSLPTVSHAEPWSSNVEAATRGPTSVEDKKGSSSSSSSRSSSTSSSRTREESISGFLAGAALAATKTIVKYPLDTATVRLQMPESDYSIYQPGRLLQGSFRGITGPLITNIPAGAVFFAVKDAVKEFLVTTSSSSSTSHLPRWATTSLAVLVATFPYMLVRNPSEVVKTRQQAGMEGYGEGVSTWQAFQRVWQGDTETTKDDNNNHNNNNNNNLLDKAGRFYVGYWENVLYTYPADVIKFVTYDYLSAGRKNLPPLQGAIYGALSTATAQIMTTPLDVIRNRVMATTKTTATTADDDENIVKPTYLQSLTQLAKEEGMAGLFAGVSPRIGKALLSGAIQFATYEETKQVVANFFESHNKR